MKYQEFINVLKKAEHIVVIQADNPDGDSLASSLTLEALLGNLAKKVTLYCGVEIPSYLRYMSGWDRIVHELPKKFDLSIIVDTSAVSLLESLGKSGELSWLRTKPCAILDHHATKPTIDFATVTINEDTVSTGELIYNIASEAGWEINNAMGELITYSILSDSLGLTSEAVKASSVKVLAELIENGVNLAKLDNERRKLQRKSAELTAYKGRLLQRIEYEAGGRLALLHIPWEEIEKYSYAYNPSMLVIDEMRMVEGVNLAIAFKTYPDGKVTAKIRSNYGIQIANTIAERFGGGGHVYAAGFKIVDGHSYNQIKSECIKLVSELLDRLEKEKEDETIQHADTAK
jgi:bifunctional oligoribonuclease and PAP phosphatase NrnA